MTTQATQHGHCVVCGAGNPGGLHLEFAPDPGGGVVAEFTGGPGLEGYEGLLHGGVISALVDGAMTNCLFARDIVAVTAELNVRFMAGVRAGRPVRVSARHQRTRGPVYVVTAEVRQDGQPVVRAVGKFLDKSRSRAAAG